MSQGQMGAAKALGRNLTASEAEIMKIVWARGSVTVRDVFQEINRPLAYTTVMTTMKVLREKGFIERNGRRGRGSTYHAVISREAAGRDILDYVAKYYFDESIERLIMSLIRSNQNGSEK